MCELSDPFETIDLDHGNGAFGDLIALEQEKGDGNGPFKNKC